MGVDARRLRRALQDGVKAAGHDLMPLALRLRNIFERADLHVEKFVMFVLINSGVETFFAQLSD